MLGICRVCNGISTDTYDCSNCKGKLNDAGRIMDYFDDYSAYLDIDITKQVDGFPTSVLNEFCPHLYHCQRCGSEEVRLVEM